MIKKRKRITVLSIVLILTLCINNFNFLMLRVYAEESSETPLESSEASTLFHTMPMVAVSNSHVVGLKNDGTVIAAGNNDYEQCEVSDWHNIVAISTSTSSQHTVGLKNDGTVVAVGRNDNEQCKVSEWSDIVAISVGSSHTIGLKKDGTVVTAGSNYYGQCNVSGWFDIIAIAAGSYFTVGLKKDGKVISVGHDGRDVYLSFSHMQDIIAISSGISSYAIGLKRDGTAYYGGTYGLVSGTPNVKVDHWQDTVAVSGILGLKNDGTVNTANDGNGAALLPAARNWQGIVAIASASNFGVGLKYDGTVVTTGSNAIQLNWDLGNWDYGNGDSLIFPQTATFDKYVSSLEHRDLIIMINPRNIIAYIKNGSKSLVYETDYYISGNVVAIKKEYLRSSSIGIKNLTFSFFNSDKSAMLAITIKNTEPQGPATIEPIVFGGFVDLKYESKYNLLGTGSNKDNPPIPSGTNSQYKNELNYWAQELGYDFSSLNLEKVLMEKIATPYMSASKEIVFDVDESKTIKGAMSDIIMLGKLQEYIIEEEKAVLNDLNVEKLNSSTKTMLKYLGRYYTYIGETSGQRYDPRVTTETLNNLAFIIDTVWDYDTSKVSLLSKFAVDDNITRNEKYDTIFKELENAKTSQEVYEAQNKILNTFSFGIDAYKSATSGYYFDFAETLIDTFGNESLKKTNDYIKIINKVHAVRSFGKLADTTFGQIIIPAKMFSKYLDFCVEMHNFIREQYPSWLFFTNYYLPVVQPEYFQQIGFNQNGDIDFPTINDINKARADCDDLSFLLIATAISNNLYGPQGAQYNYSGAEKSNLMFAAVTLGEIRTQEYKKAQKELLNYISAQFLPTGQTITARVACPVDVMLIDAQGNEVFCLSNNDEYPINYNEFCTYYLSGGNRDEKLLIFDANYALKIIPYENATMDCTIITADINGTTKEFRFEDVPIDSNSQFTLSTSEDIPPVLKEVVGNNQFTIPLTSEVILADSLDLNYTEVDMNVNDTLQLIPYIQPINAVNTTVKWNSSNPEILCVDDSGYLMAISPGKAIITATIEKTAIIATCEITVKPNSHDLATITYDVKGKGTISTIEMDNYLIGDKVMISAIPEDGYKFVKWAITNNGIIENPLNEYTYFTVPNRSSLITAYFELVADDSDSKGNGSDGGRSTTQSGLPDITLTLGDGKETPIGGGFTVTTSEGQDPISNPDGSLTLPDGGTINKPGSTIIIAPPGTVIDSGGKISFPKGSGGGTITLRNGHTFNIPDDAVIILDRDTPLGYYILVDNPFADVNESNWFYDHVMFTYTHGLMASTSTTPMLFSPNMATTRGMIVTILYRMEGSPDVSDLLNPFSDVLPSKWYSNAVVWAVANGIVSGYGNGKFGSEDDITREQMALILFSYIKYKGYTLPTKDMAVFNDKPDIASWALEAAKTMQAAGIISGKPDNLYDPKALATRFEVATILQRFLEVTEK